MIPFFDSRSEFIDIFKSYTSFRFFYDSEEILEDDEYFYIRAPKFKYKLPKSKDSYFYIKGGSLEDFKLDFYEGEKKDSTNIQSFNYKITKFSEKNLPKLNMR